MQSESIAKLVTALAKAQKMITPPGKNREVTVTPRSGGSSYKFSYTTLDALIEHVRAPLTENGLWFVQTTDAKDTAGNFVLRTVLLHESGEWISGEIPMLDPGNNQQLGSALTYQRRYALAGILGIASDSDDDANGADGNAVEAVKDKVVDRRPVPAKPAPSDAAKKAAIAYAQKACEELAGLTVKEQLTAWLHTNQSKVDKLKDYDKELYDTVTADVIYARTRIS